MNDLEIYAAIFCVSAIATAGLFTWLFGKSDCQNDCCQGRRCKCQKESLK